MKNKKLNQNKNYKDTEHLFLWKEITSQKILVTLQRNKLTEFSSKEIYNMYQISFELKCHKLYTRNLTLVEVHAQHSTWSEFILYVYICVANINSVYSCVYEWFYIHIKLTRKKFKNII